jgi:hypothetical protein
MLQCKSKKDVLRIVKDKDVSFIQFWFTDILGILKSFAITPSELEGALEEGMGFDGSSIEGFARIEESDMIAVHGICGSWGTLALGLFAQDKFSPGTTGNGLFFGGSWPLIGAQAFGVISVFTWCMLAGFMMFYVIKHLVGLRVSREEELRGLDIDEHGMEAYSGFQVFTTQ